MNDLREVKESPRTHGTAEARAYEFNFTGQGVTTITAAQAIVTEAVSGEDVSADTLAAGSSTVAGLLVTTPKLQNLDAGVEYRLTCRVTHDGGQVSELYLRVFGKR